ncbi:hypothetical protein [Pseudocitrobacter faecalis]|uniref:hypothetical protein n=1 Tax=Pseudocitrobacter faecalis TaxID=1398493 RepID=UPI003BA27880
MLDKLYFWKGGGTGGGSSAMSLLLIILVLLILMGGGAGGYWYYSIYIPEQQQKAEQEALVAQRQADISYVNTFYESSLEGIAVPQAISLFGEIHRGTFPIWVAQVGNTLGFSCDTKKCNFSFELEDGIIATYPSLTLWGKTYKASPFLPKSGKVKFGFQYTNVAVKLESNEFLKAYKAKKPIALFPCGEILSYITAYNSYLGKTPQKGGVIKLKTFPATTVEELEKKLGSQVYAFGIRSATWEIEVKEQLNNDLSSPLTDMQALLYQQPYRSAFLIRKIDSTDKGMKVSGGLVCKA